MVILSEKQTLGFHKHWEKNSKAKDCPSEGVPAILINRGQQYFSGKRYACGSWDWCGTGDNVQSTCGEAIPFAGRRIIPIPIDLFLFISRSGALVTVGSSLMMVQKD
jgi:hypothetical protein